MVYFNRIRLRQTSAWLCCLFLTPNLYADWQSGSPDSHAPIGVMGDHIHKESEWMFSYRYMEMDMDTNKSGSDSINAREIVGTPTNPGSFLAAPTRMKTEMHMFGAMYAPTDRLTMMFSLPYISKEMDHITRTGVKFTTNSEGFGDLKVAGLYDFFAILQEDTIHRFHLNLGLSVPTGSIDNRDDTLNLDNNQKLGYPMHLGSGTFDLMPGITYNAQNKTSPYTWGGQLMTTLRLGKNDNGYRQGNQLMTTGWLSRKWNEKISTSMRLGYMYWGDVSGSDSDLNPNMIQIADPDIQGGERVDLSLSLNYLFSDGYFAGQRLAIEMVKPVYQDLNGSQLGSDLMLLFGWQRAY